MNFGRIARDLHEEALAERLPSVVGRDFDRDRLVKLLSDDSVRRILVTGPPGVGKTALIHGVAQHLAANESPLRLYEVDPTALNANTVMVREHFNKLTDLCDQNKNTWLVMDQLSALLSGDTLNDSQELLLHAAETGERKVLFSLRADQWRSMREANHPLVEGPEVIELSPLDARATTKILYTLKPDLETECSTVIADEAVFDAVSMSRQYLPDQALPGSAIDILARASRRHRKKTDMGESPAPWMDKSTMKNLGKAVGAHDIRRVVGELTGFDVVAIEKEGWKKTIAEGLNEALPGREGAIGRLASVVALIRQDMAQRGRPSAVVVLAGPSGSGKTRAAEILARSLPSDPESAFLFDLAQFDSPEAAKRLYEDGAAANPAPKPLAVAVFKGLEHAHEDVRRRLGKSFTSREPHREFAWGAPYQRSLYLATFDITDAFAMESDLVDAAERFLDLAHGTLKANAVYFAPDPH